MVSSQGGREQRAGRCRYGETGEGQQCRKRQVGEQGWGHMAARHRHLPPFVQLACSSSKARLNCRCLPLQNASKAMWVAFVQAGSISGDMTVARLASPPQSYNPVLTPPAYTPLSRCTSTFIYFTRTCADFTSSQKARLFYFLALLVQFSEQ